jgi:hypothetical protein
MKWNALVWILLLACSDPKKGSVSGRVMSGSARPEPLATADNLSNAALAGETGPGADTANADRDPLPPPVIAGAYLSCTPAVSKNVFACEIFGPGKRPLIFDGRQAFRWSLVDKNGTRSPLNSVKRDINALGASLFFVTTEREDGSLLVESKVNQAKDELSLKVDLSRLPADGIFTAISNSEAFIQSIYILSNTGPLDSFFFRDGAADSSRPECLSHARSVFNGSDSLREITQKFTLEEDSIGYFGLLEVCDLNSPDVVVTVTFPDSRVLKSRLVFSPEESADQMVTDKMTMKAGEYTITVSQPDIPGAKRDGFYFRGLGFFNEDKGDLQYTLGALSWK